MINPYTTPSSQEWIDRTTPLLNILQLVIFPSDDWREWADYVFRYPQIAGKSPPRHDSYSDWRDWAARFNETVLG